MEKMWVVRLTHKIPMNKLDRWCSAIKKGKYKTKELAPITWQHHFELRNSYFTQTRIIFPITKEGKVVVELFWCLAPEKGWLPGMAVGLSWEQGNWQTELSPELAEHLIHLRYFPCFTQQAVRQAILGEKLLTCCQQYHRGAGGNGPPSLQYICLRVAIKYGKATALTPTNALVKASSNFQASATIHDAGCKRRSHETLSKGRINWRLELLCRVTSRARVDRRTGLGSLSNRLHKEGPENDLATSGRRVLS
ncbi:vif protein [Simian immunodeficiency virus]|uniref:Virion infectivity factor n=1 Tax=Simian immunodeficiency virus TaxID=11723 RepID=D5G2R7_SIV|nr:vif protein [Simian immunodeficiency virus]